MGGHRSRLRLQRRNAQGALRREGATHSKRPWVVSGFSEQNARGKDGDEQILEHSRACRAASCFGGSREVKLVTPKVTRGVCVCVCVMVRPSCRTERSRRSIWWILGGLGVPGETHEANGDQRGQRKFVFNAAPKETGGGSGGARGAGSATNGSPSSRTTGTCSTFPAARPWRRGAER